MQYVCSRVAIPTQISTFPHVLNEIFFHMAGLSGSFPCWNLPPWCRLTFVQIFLFLSGPAFFERFSECSLRSLSIGPLLPTIPIWKTLPGLPLPHHNWTWRFSSRHSNSVNFLPPAFFLVIRSLLSSFSYFLRSRTLSTAFPSNTTAALHFILYIRTEACCIA